MILNRSHSAIIKLLSFLIAFSLFIVFTFCYDADPISDDDLITDSEIVIPRGTSLVYETTFPIDTNFTGGYFQPDGTIITAYIATESVTLGVGTVFLDYVVIPEGSNLGSDTLLPGGRQIDGSYTISTYGAIIPPAKSIPGTDNTYAWVPGGTTITGNTGLVAEEYNFPANTFFPMGYQLPTDSGEIDDSNRGDIMAVRDDSGNPIPPDSYPKVEPDPVTIPVNAIFYGGATVDDAEIMQLPSTQTGGVLILSDKSIPTPGLSLPAGSFLPLGAVIPEGSVIEEETVFPNGTIFTEGYIDSSGDYVQPQSATAEVTLSEGSVLTGTTIIPPVTASTTPTGTTGTIFLAGGSLLDNTGIPTSLIEPGLISAEGSSHDFGESLPPSSVVMGTINDTGDAITFPANTEFSAGYKKDDAYIQPGVQTAEIILDFVGGDELYGGAILPDVFQLHNIGESAFTFGPAFKINNTDTIRTPGLNLPAQSAFPNGATIPKGATTVKAGSIPTGATYHNGHISETDVYTEGEIVLSTNQSVNDGFSTIDEITIPADTNLSESMYLVGGSALGVYAPASVPVVGAITPHNATIQTSTEGSYISPNTYIIGSEQALTTDMIFPANTEFTAGYYDGTDHVQATIITTQTTLSAGSILYGAAIINESMQLPEAQLVNPIVIMSQDALSDDILQSPPGIYLPENTQLIGGLVLSEGSAFREESELPAGTDMARGYMTDPTDPTSLVSGPISLTTAQVFTQGTLLVGNAVISANETVTTTGLYVSGGSYYIDTAAASSGSIGGTIPIGTILTYGAFTTHRINADSLFLASTGNISSTITFPAGSEFKGGYRQGGVIFDAVTSTADITLNSGDELFGGVKFPAGYDFTSDINVVTPLILPGGLQEADGITLPVGTEVPLGLEDDDNNTICNPGDIVGTDCSIGNPVEVGEDWLYGQTPSFISKPVAFGRYNDSRMSFETNLPVIATVYYNEDGSVDPHPSTATPGVDCETYTFPATGPIFDNVFMPDPADLSPNTVYQYYVEIDSGIKIVSDPAGSPRRFMTTDPCAGDFELVSVGPVPTGWTGTFGTGSSTATSMRQIVTNPGDGGRVYFLGQRNDTGLPYIWKTALNLLDIIEPTISFGSSDQKIITAGAHSVFDGTDNFHTLSISNSNKGFRLQRATSADWETFSAEFGTGGNAEDSPGFGYAHNEMVDDIASGNGYTYISSRIRDGVNVSQQQPAKIYMADNNDAVPGGWSDFMEDADGTADATPSDGGGYIYQTASYAEQGISEIEIFSGNVYATIEVPGGDAKLISAPHPFIKGTSSFSDISMPAGFNGVGNERVEDLTVINVGGTDYLFMTTNNANGAQVWNSTDGISWSKVIDFADGTGLASSDASNTAVNFIIENGDTSNYYLGTTNSTGAEIWSSVDAISWSKVEAVGCTIDGFGFGDFERFTSAESVELAGGEHALYVSLENPLESATDSLGLEGQDVKVYRKIDN